MLHLSHSPVQATAGKKPLAEVLGNPLLNAMTVMTKMEPYATHNVMMVTRVPVQFAGRDALLALLILELIASSLNLTEEVLAILYGVRVSATATTRMWAVVKNQELSITLNAERAITVLGAVYAHLIAKV